MGLLGEGKLGFSVDGSTRLSLDFGVFIEVSGSLSEN